MADQKISALGELAAQPAANDLAVVVDISDTSMAASGTDKKIQYSNLMGGAWQSWVPSWVNLTIGSATVTAKYCQIGKTVFGRLSMVFAANTSVTGTIVTFSLPVTSAGDYSATVQPIGAAVITDSGTATMPGICLWVSTTTAKIEPLVTSGTYAVRTDVTSTVPMTWTTADGMYCEFTYEAA